MIGDSVVVFVGESVSMIGVPVGLNVPGTGDAVPDTGETVGLTESTGGRVGGGLGVIIGGDPVGELVTLTGLSVGEFVAAATGEVVGLA